MPVFLYLQSQYGFYYDFKFKYNKKILEFFLETYNEMDRILQWKLCLGAKSCEKQL